MAWENMVERDPETKMALLGHAHLLVKHGIHIIENLNLEELAAAKIYEFGFVGIPLKFRGATGSPITPLALGLAFFCSDVAQAFSLPDTADLKVRTIRKTR